MAITGETLNERTKGKDVRTSNIVAAKGRSGLLTLAWDCVAAVGSCDKLHSLTPSHSTQPLLSPLISSHCPGRPNLIGSARDG